MAKVNTVVTFEVKEIKDALLELAKKQTKDNVGGATITFQYEANETLSGASVSFNGVR